MVKAAAKGVVDFKTAQLLDRRWWRRLNWLLGEMETDLCLELIQISLNQHAAALSYESGKEAFTHHWKQLNDLRYKWIATALPWLADKIGQDTAKTNEALIDQWKTAFGDLSDPETQKALADTHKSLLNLTNAPKIKPPNVKGMMM